MTRPPVSIVIPVPATSHGPREDLLRRLDLGAGDEVQHVTLKAGTSLFRACNEGVAEARHEWVLLLDPLAEPATGLLDAYLGDEVSDRCGALVGVAPPFARPGNVMFRASAYRTAGGLFEDVRLGAEAELCHRLMELGWQRIPRPEARVEVRATGGLGARMRRGFVLGATRRWLSRRGVPQDQQPRGGRLAGAIGVVAGSNRVAEAAEPRPAGAVAFWTDAYPARSETFIYNEADALAALGRRIRVESLARPHRIEQGVARRHHIHYLEDSSWLESAVALARVVARHPLRAFADRRDRPRFGREEETWPLRSIAPAVLRQRRFGDRHAHVHFLAGACLNAMRACGITGVRSSVVGHGYDVFQAPRNLGLKLGRADIVVAPCSYTARALSESMAPPSSRPVHVVVMGVDPEIFRRTKPYPGGRSVVAVGRLVEKKGFTHLIEAAALLEDERPLDRVTIVGDGPLRGELERQIEALGLSRRVAVIQAWGASEVRAELERADILAMPAVIAQDGDRDAMPVVVKEAMAMELPIVGSDEVGLPELVDESTGRLVSPGDPEALAEALAEVLDLPVGDRIALGRAGRQHVVEHCSIATEARRLAALIGADSAVPGGARPSAPR
jgi:glycosyltransferase involved in cell wall biosynthesis